MMTNLVGTIADSMNIPLNGTLEITLAGLMIDLTTVPDKISTGKTNIVTITSGVINISLQESASSGISYHFVFKDTLGNVWMDFNAIVPDGLGSPVQLALLVPTGITNDTLDTGSIRVATLLTTDPRFVNIVKPVYECSVTLNLLAATQSIYFSKPFAGGILFRSLTGFIQSGISNWAFDVGVIKADGTDEILVRPTATILTAGGRSKVTQIYTDSRINSSMGLIIKATLTGTGTVSGNLTLTFLEV